MSTGRFVGLVRGAARGLGRAQARGIAAQGGQVAQAIACAAINWTLRGLVKSVAGVACFLMGHDSGHRTGTGLALDGGGCQMSAKVSRFDGLANSDRLAGSHALHQGCGA